MNKGKNVKNTPKTVNEVEENVSFSIHQVQVILKMQEETIMNFIKMSLDRVDNKIDDIKVDVININRDIEDLKQSASFKGDQVSQLEKKVGEAENRLKNLKSSTIPEGMLNHMKNVLDNNNKINEKLTDLEDRSRRNNIRIIGIPENEKETTTETENKVQRLFQKDLGINEEVIIERAHRSGPKIFKDGKPNSKRVIVMKLLNYKDKQKILKRYAEKQLYNKSIYINEDFSEKTVAIRKELFAAAKQLRLEGKYAKVSYKRLVTDKNQDETGTSAALDD